MSAPKWQSGPKGQSFTIPRTLIFALFMIGYVHAVNTTFDDILNNLGSDLAPLLALFGEQVTIQYLSESFSLFDNYIFALAPLGIITAMISAIRVSDSIHLRTLIGRAKESRGTVEAEVMSSTSPDVCELWNGKGVARVLGSPTLLQLVYVPREVPIGDGSSNKSSTSLPLKPTDLLPDPLMIGPQTKHKHEPGPEIYTFAEAAGKGIYQMKPESEINTLSLKPTRVVKAIKEIFDKTKSCWYPETPSGSDPESNPLNPEPENTQDLGKQDPKNPLSLKFHPPNLSLNASMKPVGQLWQCIFAAFGTGSQASVIAFAWLIQYRYKWPNSNDAPIPGYSFHVFLVGTLLLFAGMFLCAVVVGGSTEEVRWKPTQALGSKTPRLEVVWLQQGGQTVGDQLFESFALRSTDTTIITSSRSTEGINSLGKTLVWLAISASLAGFVIQFVGLRATHPYVTAAQLGAILVMTAVRSFCKLDRRSTNDIKEPDQVDGHELDWLAKNLKGCEKWEIVTGPDNPAYSDIDEEIYMEHM